MTVLVVDSHNLDGRLDTTCVTIQVVNYFDGSCMPGFQVSRGYGGFLASTVLVAIADGSPS